MEIRVEAENCPTHNYGKWSEIYRYLFEREPTIEWTEGETIRFFTYPPADGEDAWIELLIPSACFWPKPSRDIRH